MAVPTPAWDLQPVSHSLRHNLVLSLVLKLSLDLSPDLKLVHSRDLSLNRQPSSRMLAGCTVFLLITMRVLVTT